MAESAVEEIGRLLRQRGQTLAVAESATGGLISYLITSVPGSSDYFRGGVVAYHNDAKMNVLGVQKATLEQHGAVSPPVAEEMARGVRQLLAADFGLADTGIAGPGGATPTKPVGLFYLCLAYYEGTEERELLLQGDREQNRRAAAQAALELLLEYLRERREKA